LTYLFLGLELLEQVEVPEADALCRPQIYVCHLFVAFVIFVECLQYFVRQHALNNVGWLQVLDRGLHLLGKILELFDVWVA